MESIIKITTCIFLTGILVFISCKKEYSCESCTEKNKPPIAVAGSDRVITLPTDSVSLDGSSSSDPDGTISSFLWTKISGPASFIVTNASTARTVVKNLTVGNYQFELKVTDNGGLSAKDTIQVIVDAVPTDHPPVANAGPDQTITLPTNTINLDGRGSTDPDNNITGYAWTKISGAASFNIVNVNAAQTQVTNLVQGAYQFELKVTDAGGLSAKDTVQVIVNDSLIPNRPPVANAGLDQTIILPTNTITLNGNGSTDPDNNITSYTWTKISGPSSYNIANASSVQTQVINLVEGIYQFELKVTDADGLFSKDTMQVTISATSVAVACDGSIRPQVNVQLIPITTLPMVGYSTAVAVGNKMLFAGESNGPGTYTSRVDIFDVTTNSWSIAELSQPRVAITAAVLASEVFFAGGWTDTQPDLSSRVDIYNAVTNTWRTAELSSRGSEMVAASAGNKVLFAGGFRDIIGTIGYPNGYSNRVDIYDASTNMWSIDSLTGRTPEAVIGISATAIGEKIFFAGASQWAWDFGQNSSTINIYDAATNTWSISALSVARGYMAAIAVGNKNYWAGGNGYPGSAAPSDQVEIRDMNTNTSSFACLFQPNAYFSAVQKNNKIVFFTGGWGGLITNKFDIYDTATNSWSIGVLGQNIEGASIFSINNTIYVAGGYVNGVLSNQVWKLEF